MTTERRASMVACVQGDDKLRVLTHTLQQSDSCPHVGQHPGQVRRAPPGITIAIEPNFMVFLTKEDLSSYLGERKCLS
ncbi:MAG: hypothetical protein JSU86_16835 [Phycisphaerales bacterium]|nr:MAG: hypothetical protein JSU86_16835 [Phycisphaerales bacterium]